MSNIRYIICFEFLGENFFGSQKQPNKRTVQGEIEKALEMGADKIVFALSKPKNFRRSSSRNDIIAKLIRRKYPEAARVLLESNAEYDRLVDKAIELEKEGRVLIVSPDDTCGVDTLTKDKEKLHLLYEKGYRDAEKIKEFLK